MHLLACRQSDRKRERTPAMQVHLAPKLQLMMTHSRVVHQTIPLQGQMLHAIPSQVCTQLCKNCTSFCTCESAVH